MQIKEMARVAHEVNRAYCQALEDFSQLPWEEAPQWQKDSAIAGVKMHLQNPNAGPEASHESWMEQKLADGWTYGETKDPEAKTHPCLVPFHALPTHPNPAATHNPPLYQAMRGRVIAESVRRRRVDDFKRQNTR
jgi:hypothetical protein